MPHERSKTRTLNAWIAAGISAFFFAHACLGTTWLFWPDMPTSLMWLLEIGLFAICLHIALSLITTYEMFTDTVRPASPTKRAHQWKKWITGGLLIAAAICHQVSIALLAELPLAQQVSTPLLALTAIMLCIHMCTGVKSLTRDLNASSRLRTPLHVAAIVLCVGLCGAILVFLLR